MSEALPLAVPGATIPRQVAWLAGPVLVEQALLYLVGLSDTILTGRYLGAGRPDLAGRAARTAWALGTAALSAIGLVLYTQAGPMFAIFLGGRQGHVASEGVPVLKVVALALPALRGAGDTRWPWLFVLVGYLAVRLPLTYLLTTPEALGGLGWGLYGAWVAMFADLYVRAFLVAGRFLQGGWHAARV